jgi:hypothetical protein
MFLPFNCHIDGGFGAMGDAFYEVAEELLVDKEKKNFLNANLPINFLFRHTIELYLKSLIIVIHRSLKIPFGVNANSTPSIIICEKWKPIHQVHSIKQLYMYFKKLIYDNQSDIQSITKHDWSTIPPELDSWIDEIEKYDCASTFFRYPAINNPQSDIKKSAWKEVAPNDLEKSIHSSKKPTKSFVFADGNDAVLNAYQYDDATMEDVSELLKKTANLLSGAHCGIRAELAGGK